MNVDISNSAREQSIIYILLISKLYLNKIALLINILVINKDIKIFID